MKIVYYTCQTGPGEGYIPSIKEQIPDGIEAYFLHDGYLGTPENRGWNYIDLTKEADCPTASFQLRQRYGRFLHHRWFPDADWTIYTDQKYYLHRNFWEECLSLIENATTEEFFTLRHPEKRTLYTELLKPFNTGQFTFDVTVKTLHYLKNNGYHPDDFVSTLTCFLLRKNCPSVNGASQRWYQMLQDAYDTIATRDQPLLPYAGANLTLLDESILTENGIPCYPNRWSRRPGQPEIHREPELREIYDSLFST